MWKQFSIALISVGCLVLATFAAVGAWPNQPPTKALISGPGLEGQVEIKDSTVLEVLRLGSLEDLAWGVVPAPINPGDGFKIIRYFDGDFQFADLTYYPNGAGTHSLVFFQDGPMLQGDHTPYNNQWLFTTRNGDAVMRMYLRKLGAVLPSGDQVEARLDAVKPDPLPKVISVGTPVSLGMTLNQHAKIVTVRLNLEGDNEQVILAASASGKPGHYALTYTFSRAGVWNWSVQAQTGGPQIPLPPLTVQESESAVTKSVTAPAQAAPVPAQPESTIPLFEFAAVAAVLGIFGVVSALVLFKRKSEP